MPDIVDKIKISCLIGTYNEEGRISSVLKHAVRWADEIIVIDKQSTDRTVDVCRGFGSQVKVISIPYSPQGHDDVEKNLSYASYDWVYINTCSEIPSRNLIVEIRKLLEKTNGKLDLIYVPRRMFSFGINSPNSPWYVSYYPFLINKGKAIISNQIHGNFHPADSANTGTICYSDDCCVFHLTHPTASQYVHSISQYFVAEAEECKDPEKKLRECFHQIQEYSEKIFKTGDDWVGIYSAWSLYWLGTALFVWEKQRGLDTAKYYSEIASTLIESEWSDHPKAPFSLPALEQSLPRNSPKFNKEMRNLVLPGYFVRTKIKLRKWLSINLRLRIVLNRILGP